LTTIVKKQKTHRNYTHSSKYFTTKEVYTGLEQFEGESMMTEFPFFVGTIPVNVFK